MSALLANKNKGETSRKLKERCQNMEVRILSVLKNSVVSFIVKAELQLLEPTVSSGSVF